MWDPVFGVNPPNTDSPSLGSLHPNTDGASLELTTSNTDVLLQMISLYVA